MKKYISVLLIIIITVFIFIGDAFSQTDTLKIKLETIYPGYVITLDNDTVQGFIMLSNLVENQKKVLFYNSPEDEEPSVKYKPKLIKAYLVGPRYYVTFKFQPEGEAYTYYFFLRVLNGPVKLFKWYRVPENQSRLRVQVGKDKSAKFGFIFSEDELESQGIAIKLDSKPVNLASRKFQTNFKKHMSALVEENTELVRKISDKEDGYTLEHIENIIVEYNFWYSTVYL